MIPYIGDFAEDATIYHYFNTFDSNSPAASVTMSTLLDTDLYVYKDGNIVDLVTDGASVVIDFDGRTGIHKLTIDTSVHADYSTGSDYMVIIEGATIDGGIVNAAIFSFSIENRFDAAFERIGALGAGLTDLGGMSTGMKAEINTEADAAIETYHLHHLLHTDYDPASKPGTATALLNELVENNGGVSRYTAAALAQGPGGTPSQPLLQSTTILSYSSNTSFTLTTASPDDDAYLNQMCVITDQATSEQRAIGRISAYTGASKTVTLDVDPLPAFTFAVGDKIEIWAITGNSVGIDRDASGRVNTGKVFDVTQTGGDLATAIAGVQSTANTVEADLANGTDGLGAIKSTADDILADTADIQPNYATSTALGIAQTDLDTITGTDGVTLATSQTLYIPATATALQTVDNEIAAIDTAVGLIKTETDKLTFTVANQIDANIKSVDDAAISEGGSAPASPYGQT